MFDDKDADPAAIKELEEKFDPEVRFRPLGKVAAGIAATLLFLLSCFHYYTAGFGLLREVNHRGVHLAFVLSLIFIVFAATKKGQEQLYPSSLWRPFGIPVIDWLLAIAAIAASLYVPYIFDDLAFRVGNPLPIDVIMGTVMIVVLLEATRRAMGWPLPVIAIVIMAYGLFGQYAPGVLVHPGADWRMLVNHLYLTSQGIYGLPVGVVATYVFHFVLFGVLATRIGLGRLFIDIAMAIAGRYSGGPAKVSVFSSALLGSISGSSIANTVTTGALTIPAMIRIGYQRHFAAAVEAASSTGGQITPPVMGAAAFLMIEFLGVSYSTIITAAIVPAFMHFFGVLCQVHFEAKRLGLRGLTRDELPRVGAILKRDWPTVIPLIILISILLQGFTPYLAAFYAITACIVIGLVNPLNRITWRDVLDAFILGAKYALAVGAAAATVGIIIGVVTLTGVSFKIAYMVTSTAGTWASAIAPFIPFGIMGVSTLTLLITLILTAMVCIVMGCGIPTTATYLIMVSVAAPVLGLLGVAPLVAHFFVFYYGVLADITPPVALAAYAGAGIANANPFRAGNTAFRLGMGKALVPFVFVFAPSLLIVVDDFSWFRFFLAFTGTVIGITALSAAFAGWLAGPLYRVERWLLGIAAALLVAPEVVSTSVGLVLVAAVVARQLFFSGAEPEAPDAASA
ncbi:TRAP transporter permease [Consotaella salsifontis]|uniref:TRAP transporter, 4TM/12TM fusion protein n=1 Tax=Consotaella salsifontis TaxID=1365950 RepID=A0A1T4T3I3_9HYPH|nr:TRAP transporter permease [Consotaella salsifontis]SKA35032.1 TRAP transporter, 4TM/12TM fusion protein [Consotaella salsifontis]